MCRMVSHRALFFFSFFFSSWIPFFMDRYCVHSILPPLPYAKWSLLLFARTNTSIYCFIFAKSRYHRLHTIDAPENNEPTTKWHSSMPKILVDLRCWRIMYPFAFSLTQLKLHTNTQPHTQPQHHTLMESIGNGIGRQAATDKRITFSH